LKGIDGEIAAKKSLIAEQKALAPVFATLKNQSEKKKPAILPMPAPEKLPPVNIGALPDVFRQAAAKNGLTLVSASPDMGGLTGAMQSVPIEVVLRGNIAAFRKFLIHVGGIPYIDHVEKLEIQVEKEARQFRAVFLISVG
jgi:Tfp pilus assembly protein PilO